MNMIKEMQEKINYWMEQMAELTEEKLQCELDGNEFRYQRSLDVYRGRIYAARTFEEIIGCTFDTDYISKNVSRNAPGQ